MNSELELFRENVRRFVAEQVVPNYRQWEKDEIFPRKLWNTLGEQGLLAVDIPEEYGGAGLDQISYGLIMQEIERGDSGVRSTASVQSSLVMYPIYAYGNVIVVLLAFCFLIC